LKETHPGDHPCHVWCNLVQRFQSSYMTMSSLTYMRGFFWIFSFSRFIPIMQIRHILIKDHI
jgi:hypothetical protein